MHASSAHSGSVYEVCKISTLVSASSLVPTSGARVAMLGLSSTAALSCELFLLALDGTAAEVAACLGAQTSVRKCQSGHVGAAVAQHAQHACEQASLMNRHRRIFSTPRYQRTFCSCEC